MIPEGQPGSVRRNAPENPATYLSLSLQSGRRLTSSLSSSASPGEPDAAGLETSLPSCYVWARASRNQQLKRRHANIVVHLHSFRSRRGQAARAEKSVGSYGLRRLHAKTARFIGLNNSIVGFTSTPRLEDRAHQVLDLEQLLWIVCKVGDSSVWLLGIHKAFCKQGSTIKNQNQKLSSDTPHSVMGGYLCCSQGCCNASAAEGRCLGSTVSSVLRKVRHPSSASGTRNFRLVCLGRSSSYLPCAHRSMILSAQQC